MFPHGISSHQYKKRIFPVSIPKHKCENHEIILVYDNGPLDFMLDS